VARALPPDITSIPLTGRTGRPTARRKPRKQWKYREQFLGYLFIAPWFIGLLLFNAGPLASTFYNSLTNFDLFSDPQWVGLQNYVRIFTRDGVFWQICRNMALYMVGSTVIVIGGGLLFAVLLNRRFASNHFFRTVIYVPRLLVGVASGILFKRIFASGEVGLLNVALGLLGIAPINWITDYDHLWHGMMTLILTNIWFIGGPMLIFLVGLKGIAPEYIEAAKIDGAGPWRTFFHVFLPLLSPAIVLNTILVLIDQIQVFDIPLTFAQKDGSLSANSPLGYHDSLGTFLTYIYQQGFQLDNFGYASALAVVVFLITLVLTLLILWFSRRLSYYNELEKN